MLQKQIQTQIEHIIAHIQYVIQYEGDNNYPEGRNKRRKPPTVQAADVRLQDWEDME